MLIFLLYILHILYLSDFQGLYIHLLIFMYKNIRFNLLEFHLFPLSGLSYSGFALVWRARFRWICEKQMFIEYWFSNIHWVIQCFYFCICSCDQQLYITSILFAFWMSFFIPHPYVNLGFCLTHRCWWIRHDVLHV